MNPIIKYPLTVIFMVVWVMGIVPLAVFTLVLALTLHINGTAGVLDKTENVLNAWVDVLDWWRMV